MLDDYVYEATYSVLQKLKYLFSPLFFIEFLHISVINKGKQLKQYTFLTQEKLCDTIRNYIFHLSINNNRTPVSDDELSRVKWLCRFCPKIVSNAHLDVFYLKPQCLLGKRYSIIKINVPKNVMHLR